MKRTATTSSRAVVFLSCAMLCVQFVFPDQPRDLPSNKGNNAGSSWVDGIARSWSEIKRCANCHIEEFKAGSEPLDQVASYTRHRKQGFCRTHAGGFIHEYDASSCSDHEQVRVKPLLDLCLKAVTYHLPTGEITVVEADPIPGKRDRTQGGPYAKRITEKPEVAYARVCAACGSTVSSRALYYVQLLDSSDRVLMSFECVTPLKSVKTEVGAVYEISEHILKKARQHLDVNGVTTAAETTHEQLQQRSRPIPETEWRTP
ncbi:hypothetical protein JST99_02435 [Candidatus Dependentiae bacterium]|nr:hypothetical protein [Candidatus Dependentiae bacterium]MCC7414523.1 hypothetical protein [Campylobacterota bacterium]